LECHCDPQALLVTHQVVVVVTPASSWTHLILPLKCPFWLVSSSLTGVPES
jgi:hypothetical protein